MRTLTTLVLASAFVGGSIVIAAAQSTSNNWMKAPGSVSSATHCLDRDTQQPKLKSAAAPSGTANSSTSGSGAASPSGSASGSSGSASGSASSDWSSAGLQPCP